MDGHDVNHMELNKIGRVIAEKKAEIRGAEKEIDRILLSIRGKGKDSIKKFKSDIERQLAIEEEEFNSYIKEARNIIKKLEEEIL